MALSVPQLLTPEEVGLILGRHPKTVLALFNRGELAGIRLGARSVRFDPADVQDYIDAHRTVAAT
jgi:excisionase family DNA binding protein